MTKFCYVTRIRHVGGHPYSQYGFCEHSNVAFLEYYACLTSPGKTRYYEKVFVCGFDPYMLKNQSVARI